MRTKRQRLVAAGGVCAVAWLVSGCAARTLGVAPPESSRPATARASVGTPSEPPASAPDVAAGHQDTKVPAGREAAASKLEHLETQDSRLAEALAALAQGETGAHHRRVAEAYRRAGVLDIAHRHLTRATDLDRTDAAAHDGLARIWRDWGFAALGLGAAYRAIYFAPTSATAYNTLGTLLEELGHRAAARRAYTRALALDEQAVYALNNLCYLSLLDGALSEAREQCQAALRLGPPLGAVRNNLALVFAADGCLDCARQEFARVGDAAVTQYNLGIVLLSQQDYAQAAQAFEEAAALRPAWRAAGARARQARARATGLENEKVQD